MDKPEAQRKLAAILSADVVGYSRLMQADDQATLRALTECRALFDERVAAQRGRIVNAPGDSILAEFVSVVDALNCAVGIQEQLRQNNAPLPEERRMRFRMGVNLGEVLHDEKGIYGDGVNIAARLESLADPGGICLSRQAYDQVGDKLRLDFDYLGEKEVKNITQPVRVYKVLLDGDEAQPTQAAGPVYMRASPPVPTDMPSIAVLAFENMSGDPEQEYFSEGISEDIITELAKLSKLLVIARNSSFAYKGRNMDLRQVGRELGVRYLLEGSVRRAGNRVRITAQLIEAQTGAHLWASRYDRELEDIFAVQDEISEEVVTNLDVTLVGGEQARLWRNALKSPAARDSFYRGMSLMEHWGRSNLSQAIRCFEQVIELEPDSGMGFVGLSNAILFKFLLRYSADPGEDFIRAEEIALKGLEIDPEYGPANALLGLLRMIQGRYDEGFRLAEQALEFSPNGAETHFLAASGYHLAGQPEKAASLMERSLRLSPIPSYTHKWLLGLTYRESGRYEEAVPLLQDVCAANDDSVIPRQLLATVHAAMGSHEEARATVREIHRIDPGFKLLEYMQSLPYRDKSVNARMIQWLRDADAL